MKNFLQAILWLSLYIIIYANVVHGQTIHVVHARGDRSAGVSVARDMLEHALYIIRRDTGLHVKIASYKVRKNPFARQHARGLRAREEVLYLWSNYFDKLGIERGFALVPTFNDGDFKYMAGYTLGTCSMRVGYATAQSTNQFGQPRYINSVVNIAHEIGHLLGAKHDASLPATIMHPDAMPYANADSKFSDRSIGEILSCRYNK